MKARLLVVVALLVSASAASAKEKQKTYFASCDRVWKAVKTAASDRSKYRISLLDDSQKGGIIVVKSGKVAGEANITISLSETGENCTVELVGQFRGLQNHDTRDFYDRIGQALDLKP